MKKYSVLAIAIVSISCSSKYTNFKEVEIPNEGISIQIPQKWSFVEESLVNETGERLGEWGHGIFEPLPYINCQEFTKRILSNGDNIFTDEGSISFYKAEGGDVFIENEKLEIFKIKNRTVYRITSDVTSYYEDDTTGEPKTGKGIRCEYCMELSKNKIGHFLFYPDSKVKIGTADTIVSSMELLE